ncbi:hypothetical protein HZH66_013788 [Vespula vulgaris]|uniref:Uncharacterized protein n=1 Tax=Vespula vulgaris TaxID=7454 RepID=A0A834MRV7_VESVU|nr:hypothetical protein HZH66_013788 [Vespula vulgaris]
MTKYRHRESSSKQQTESQSAAKSLWSSSGKPYHSTRVYSREIGTHPKLSSPPSNPSPTPLSPTKVTQMQDADDRPRTLIPFVPKGMKNPMYIVNHRVIISDHTLESHEATTKSLGFDVKGRLVAFISIDSPLRNPGF